MEDPASQIRSDTATELKKKKKTENFTVVK